MTQPAGQTVLVTGANRGLGHEFVVQLLERGVACVCAAARDPRRVDVDDLRVVPVERGVTDPTLIARGAALDTDEIPGQPGPQYLVEAEGEDRVQAGATNVDLVGRGIAA